MNQRNRLLARALRRSWLFLIALPTAAFGFVHPGALHTSADFSRMTTQVNASAQPWLDGWNKLVANSHSSSGYTLQGPVATVYRGSGSPENYSKLYNDIAACYQNSLRWRIKGDTACGNKAVQILDAWSGTLTSIQGSADRFLAAGIYGYEFACAAENMRGYSGWSSSNFTRFQNMMKNVFYPMNHDFLVNHNGACITNYWANWDLCNIASVLAIGILCDDQAKFDEAINYFKTGAGNGSINHYVPFLYNNGALGQGQEEGRDQGHSGLDVSLVGAFCQMAYNQGQDMFALNGNKVLAACEYFADYNLGNSVPFTTYTWGSGTTCTQNSQTVISSNSRGDIRPSWALIYGHYHGVKGLAATFSGQYVAKVGVEGGGGDYGSTSGGYDQLGFGTLTCTQVASTGFPAAGTYSLQVQTNGMMLDSMGRTTNGSDCGIYGDSTSNNQKWVLSYVSSNVIKLQCVTGGIYLDGMGRTANGSTCGLWASSASTNQQWRIIDAGGGYYQLQNVATGLCLDIGASPWANGDAVEQWGLGSSSNQRWRFVAP